MFQWTTLCTPCHYIQPGISVLIYLLFYILELQRQMNEWNGSDIINKANYENSITVFRRIRYSVWTKAWFPLWVHMFIVLTTKFVGKFRGEIKKACNKESSSPIISLDIVFNSHLLLAWRVASLAAFYTIFHTTLKCVFPNWLSERKHVSAHYFIYSTHLQLQCQPFPAHITTFYAVPTESCCCEVGDMLSSLHVGTVQWPQHSSDV